MGRSRGFTLIELLMVIAVISLLAALMFPVYTRAREKGRQAACLSNLHQLALAMLLYCDDNDGGYVPAAGERGLMRWHGRRHSVSEPFDPRLGPLWEYCHSAELKACPSLSPHRQTRCCPETGAGGYGYNAEFVGGRPRTPDGFPPGAPATQGEINDPAHTVLLTDTAFLDCARTLGEYPFCNPPLVAGKKATPTTHFRHGGFANVAFCDGHCRAMRMTSTHAAGCPKGSDHQPATKEEYERADLGFLGGDNSLYDRR